MVDANGDVSEVVPSEGSGGINFDWHHRSERIDRSAKRSSWSHVFSSFCKGFRVDGTDLIETFLVGNVIEICKALNGKTLQILGTKLDICPCG